MRPLLSLQGSNLEIFLKGIQSYITKYVIIGYGSKSKHSLFIHCVTRFSLVHDITLYSPVLTLPTKVTIKSHGRIRGLLRAPGDRKTIDQFIVLFEDSHSQHPTNHDPSDNKDFETVRKPRSLELARSVVGVRGPTTFLTCLTDWICCLLWVCLVGLLVISLFLPISYFSVSNMTGEI